MQKEQKINMEAILKASIHKQIVEVDSQTEKYFENIWLFWWGIMDTNVKNGVLNAFKEFGEALVDRCAKEAELTSINPHMEKYEGGDFVYVNNPNGPDSVHFIDKESILKVKQEVEYGN